MKYVLKAIIGWTRDGCNPSLPGIFPRPWPPGSGSQGFIPHFSSFVNFSSLGKRVSFLVLVYHCDRVGELWGPAPVMYAPFVSSMG